MNLQIRSLFLLIALAISIPFALGGCASVSKQSNVSAKKSADMIRSFAEALVEAPPAERESTLKEVRLLTRFEYTRWLEHLDNLETPVIRRKSNAEAEVYKNVILTQKPILGSDLEHYVIIGEPGTGGTEVIISVFGLFEGQIVLTSQVRCFNYPDFGRTAPPGSITQLP